MAKLTVTTLVSLGGVMQAPGGPAEDPSGRFPHGGWLVRYMSEEMGAFMGDVFSRADAFLLGRGTPSSSRASSPTRSAARSSAAPL